MRHILGLAFAAFCLALPAAADEAAVQAFVADWLADQAAGDPFETRLATGFYDLDGDGTDEAIVHIIGQYWCGSGGCNTLVLRENGDSFDILMEATVTQPPIGVLRTSSNGLRDLYVHVGGGGLPFGPVAMRFDGSAYPSNPTTEGDDLSEGYKGKELIGQDDRGEVITP